MRLNPWINIYVSVLLLGVEDLNPYTYESFFVNQVQLLLLNDLLQITRAM